MTRTGQSNAALVLMPRERRPAWDAIEFLTALARSDTLRMRAARRMAPSAWRCDARVTEMVWLRGWVEGVCVYLILSAVCPFAVGDWRGGRVRAVDAVSACVCMCGGCMCVWGGGGNWVWGDVRREARASEGGSCCAVSIHAQEMHGEMVTLEARAVMLMLSTRGTFGAPQAWAVLIRFDERSPGC